MKYENLSIYDVELDTDNPRIKQYVEMYGDNITSEGIALALTATSGGDTSSYRNLKESIKVNRGIINPIIVNRKSSGKMIVIEGNTRLQIYREFAESDPKGPWHQIIAMVYDDLDINRIHAIRLQSHLVGPRDWDPYSKAKYLNQLSTIDHMPLSMIISYCGGKAGEINTYIDAYSDMQKYYAPLAESEGYQFNPQDFSKFAELQKKMILQALAIHNYTKTDFARWVLDGNIDTAQNVRKLPQILSNKVAKEHFLKGTISEAVEYLNSDEKGSKGLDKASMYDLARELIKRIQNISWNEVKSLKNDPRYADRKEGILDLRDQIRILVEDIGDGEDE